MGNTIGQANAVSDKLLDLRGCKYDGKSLAGKTLSGALMVNASFKGADLTEAVMSKAYAGARRAHSAGTPARVPRLRCWRRVEAAAFAVAPVRRSLTRPRFPRLSAAAVDANFDGASFKNAVLDRVVFNNSSMKGTSFVNAVITGSLFDGVDLTGANFEGARGSVRLQACQAS